ncbi:MAG: S-layer homology domain-containing protein [Leptolyngbyaceae cyanobacterium CSU_1_4]|nr:S-layer homology domain-containing protein [Leptolyngbyaceae cyanobacterium CSU_1_4]
MPTIFTDLNSPFTDLNNHWAKACIEKLAERKMISGYPDRTFRPNSTVSRAEFTALLHRVFPDALPMRPALSFADVPATHWAKTTIVWAYERGLLSGYPDQTFRPDIPIPRVQTIAVLAAALQYIFPAAAEETLQQYFDDAIAIPHYAKGAIAISTLKRLVVNYPNVRQLQPHKATTRGEMAALSCQALAILNVVPPQYVTWDMPLQGIKNGMTVPFAVLKANAKLVKELQTRFSALKIYPAGQRLDGKYGSQLETAIAEFCATLKLPNAQTQQLDEPFAQALLTLAPVPFMLEQARNRQKIFNEYRQQETGFSAEKLAFLDRGIQNSPYKADLPHYPDRLREVPDGIEVVSLGETIQLAGTSQTVTFTPYPVRGKQPQIDAKGLDFLHSDIKSACVCVGSMVGGKLRSHWLGKNALQNIELWSATKIIPLLNVLCRVSHQFPAVDADQCIVRTPGSETGYKFYDLAVEVVNYQQAIASSNALSAMFKQFDTPSNLENWLQKITGNFTLSFRGRYGEPPFLQTPELWDAKTQKQVLASPNTPALESNTLSTYDLTRMISMLGWHCHIPLEGRLPGGQWNSLECVVRAMGQDTARYLDGAIARLGLASVVRSTVILSKLGFGRSSIRDRTELVYTALLQFVDQRPRLENKPAVLRTVAMTLMGAKDLNDANQEALELDARMAAEVTEILRRLMTQELA